VLNWRLVCSSLSAVVAALATTGASAALARGGPAATIRPAPVFGLAAAQADRPDAVSPHHAAAPVPAAPLPVPSGAWQALGPAPIGPAKLAGGLNVGTTNAGRITALASIPSGSHAGRLVAGSAGGGIWISDDSGATWTPESDSAADMAIGALAVDPNNSNHLIAGTGEDNQCGDCFPGDGILDSTDGGSTWTLQNPSGVFDGLKIGEVAIDPNNSSHEFAATSGGLYVTTDGGSHWALPTDATYGSVIGADRVDSVVIDASASPSIIYIGGGITTGTGSFVVAKSTDGGVTWASANSGIGTPGKSPLVKLAIAKSSPSTLYASIGSENAEALYKSTNSAGSWSHLTSTPDFTGSGYGYNGSSGGSEQGWYDNALAVDPTNANHVLAGGIAVVESTDGGSTWSNVNGQGFFGGGTNKLHPDQHAFAFASDGSSVWIGDDGGVFHYTPGASPTVSSANGNLNDIQFYFGFNEIGGTVLAGTQDNASAQTSSSTLSAWTAVWTGDGGPSAITPGDTSLRFVEADGDLYSTTDAFGSETQPQDITPANNGLFTPPILLVPNAINPSSPTLFYGGASLWRTTNPAVSFPDWSSVASVSGGHVSAIAASPSNPQIVYVGFDNGAIEVSTDGGQTFNSLAAETDSGTDKFVTGLSVDPANPYAITASFSFDETRYKSPAYPHVEQYSWSGTAGSQASGTWTSVTGNLPTTAVSHVIYQTGPQGGSLIAATDAGVYATAAPNGGSTSWSAVGSGLPNVQVQDLYIDTGDPAKLYAVTHGRGAWLLQTPTPQESAPPTIAGTATQGETLTESHGQWSPNDVSYSYQWQDCDSSGAGCQDIAGATSQTYTLTLADAGHTIRVKETATTLGAASATSAATAVVLPLPPQNQAVPTISGSTTEGQTLSLTQGTWSNDPTTVSDQWEDCDTSGGHCSAIALATGDHYTLAAADVGHTIRVSESASNAGGSAGAILSAPSSVIQTPPVQPVKPSNTAAPTISGIARSGQTLTATVGQWSGTAPLRYAEQWQRCTASCVNISGASTATYKLVSADVGASLRVSVSATNAAGTTSAVSSKLGPVVAAPPSVAAIKTALQKALSPSGAAARLGDILTHNAYAFTFGAPSPGRLVITWYYLPAGAHLSRAKPIVMATARVTARRTGPLPVKVSLTKAGKSRLARSKRLTLTGVAVFAPTGGAAVTVVRRFTLRR
jgi:hypothetical protein